MENLFEIIDVSEGKDIGIRLGVRIKIANHESVCPVSKIYESPKELSEALARLSGDLERLASRAGRIFKGEQEAKDETLSPDMPPDAIWKVLSDTVDEGRFINLFNQLDEGKRRKVAEYVLTQCNVFTGKGAGFSSLYNSETAFLDE